MTVCVWVKHFSILQSGKEPPLTATNQWSTALCLSLWGKHATVHKKIKVNKSHTHTHTIMDMLRTGIWGQGLQEKSMGGRGRAKGRVEVQLRHCSVMVSITFLSRVQSCSPFASSPKYTELLTITFSAPSCLFCRGETRPEPLVLSHLTDCPGCLWILITKYPGNKDQILLAS